MIYNSFTTNLQSITTNIQPFTTIYNSFTTNIQSFKTIYNSFTTNLQSFTTIYNHLQPFTTIYNSFTTNIQSFKTIYNSFTTNLQSFTTIYNHLQPFTIHLQPIYNHLQSTTIKYNHLQSTTIKYNNSQPIYNQLQQIYNHLQPFTIHSQSITTNIQSTNIKYNHLQPFTIHLQPFTIHSQLNYNAIPDHYKIIVKKTSVLYTLASSAMPMNCQQNCKPRPTNIPANRDKNPHLQSSQTSPTGKKPAHKPPVNALQFTNAIFPKVVIPYKDLMGNFDDNIKEVIEVKPEKYLAIIPFCARNKFTRENGASTKKEYTNFLVSLGFDKNSFETAQAAPKSSTGCSNDFDKPWVWILESNIREMRTFLLWYQTFTIKPSLTFTVVPFDKKIRSWVIMNITGGAVKNVESKMHEEALGIIKKPYGTMKLFDALLMIAWSRQRLKGPLI